MGGSGRRPKQPMATFMRKKGTASMRQNAAQGTPETALAASTSGVDPYDFDIGLTGNILPSACGICWPSIDTDIELICEIPQAVPCHMQMMSPSQIEQLLRKVRVMQKSLTAPRMRGWRRHTQKFLRLSYHLPGSTQRSMSLPSCSASWSSRQTTQSPGRQTRIPTVTGIALQNMALLMPAFSLRIRTPRSAWTTQQQQQLQLLTTSLQQRRPPLGFWRWHHCLH